MKFVSASGLFRSFRHATALAAVCSLAACGPFLGRVRGDDAMPAGDIVAGTDDGLLASPEPDWPQWRGPRRDGISPEKNLLPTWPAEGPALVWKVQGLGKGWSSPIIVRDTLYITGDVGNDLVVFAYRLDGSLRWRATNGTAWADPYPGARGTCAFSEGAVYHLNAHGRLVCLDASSGAERWAVDVLKRFEAQNITWALSECLLIDGDRVMVTPGGAKGLLAALDKRTGKTIWTTPPLGEDCTSYSSPILFRHAGRRLIVTCTSHHGIGVDADTGRLLWTVPLSNQFKVNTSTPIYGAGGIYYVTPYGEEGRRYTLRSAGSDVQAELAWKCPLDTVTGAGVLVDGTLFAAGYRRSKWWFGIDWQTGQTRCEQKGLTTGAAVWADGKLFCLDESGTVGLLNAEPRRLDLRGQIRLTPKRVSDAWAHPILHHGRLYVRYHDSLWCFQVGKGLAD